MQTLGLSDSTPRPEGRLKSLLWPTIRNEGDFDYVMRLGFWVCQAVAVATIISGLALGNLLLSTPGVMFYSLAGVGARERSKIAATGVFVVYLVEAVLTGLGIVRILFVALLFANVRGHWLASRWTQEPWQPARLNETLADKFADQWPRRLWPAGRYVFYALLALMLAGMSMLAWKWANPSVNLGTMVI